MRYSGRQGVGRSGECGTGFASQLLDLSANTLSAHFNDPGFWLLFISVRLFHNKASLISDLIIDERINLARIINTWLDPIGGEALSEICPVRFQVWHQQRFWGRGKVWQLSPGNLSWLSGALYHWSSNVTPSLLVRALEISWNCCCTNLPATLKSLCLSYFGPFLIWQWSSPDLSSMFHF